MTEVLAIEHLTVTLDGNTILSDINLTINKGDIVGLVGPSGCGKTTLLNTIAGFVKFKDGQIELNQHVTINAGEFVEPENRHIGMIFQDYALFPHLSVFDNICFGIKRLNKDIQQERATTLLSLLQLTELADRYPHQLSGGQQQRVAIARALAPQPKLLLLDEPFSNIDARLRNELMLEIRQLLKQLAISAIFVTHNKDEVFTFADQMAVMNNGRILQMGPPTELCRQPNSWAVADFLQLGSWVPCTVSQETVLTALGQYKLSDSFQYTGDDSNLTEENSVVKLLVKPQHTLLEHDKQANAEIVHIAFTEQGFHYHVNSLEQNSLLGFKHLSLYSEQVFALGEKLAVSLKPHQLLVFKQ